MTHWLSFWNNPEPGYTLNNLTALSVYTTDGRRADLNLWDYTTDLLTRLPSHPIKQLEQLLPDQWKSSTNRTAASANGMNMAGRVPLCGVGVEMH